MKGVYYVCAVCLRCVCGEYAMDVLCVSTLCAVCVHCLCSETRCVVCIVGSRQYVSKPPQTSLNSVEFPGNGIKPDVGVGGRETGEPS